MGVGDPYSRQPEMGQEQPLLWGQTEENGEEILPEVAELGLEQYLEEKEREREPEEAVEDDTTSLAERRFELQEKRIEAELARKERQEVRKEEEEARKAEEAEEKERGAASKRRWKTAGKVAGAITKSIGSPGGARFHPSTKLSVPDEYYVPKGMRKLTAVPRPEKKDGLPISQAPQLAKLREASKFTGVMEHPTKGLAPLREAGKVDFGALSALHGMRFNPVDREVVQEVRNNGDVDTPSNIARDMSSMGISMGATRQAIAKLKRAGVLRAIPGMSDARGESELELVDTGEKKLESKKRRVRA